MTVKEGEPTLQGYLVREKILAILRNEEMAGRFLSIREIGSLVGLSSSSTIWNHISRLRRDGKITTSRYGHSRSIRYIKKPEELCTCCGGNGFAFHRPPLVHRGTVAEELATLNQKEVPGTELIDDKRSPEERSFGH